MCNSRDNPTLSLRLVHSDFQTEIFFPVYVLNLFVNVIIVLTLDNTPFDFLANVVLV